MCNQNFELIKLLFFNCWIEENVQKLHKAVEIN